MAIISIQSHVVYGYVGNSAAVFPMQRMGNEVYAINTVEFSNHKGYGNWAGSILDAALVKSITAALKDRGALQNCDAVLSGYLGDPSLARAIVDTVKNIKNESPSTIYACDPVMGDDKKGLYVHADIPGIYKNEIIPIADIIMPNQFELSELTGLDTSTIENAALAAKILHSKGPSIILVTSYNYKGSDPNKINMLVSDKKTKCLWLISTERLAISELLCGTGDLTSAVFLANYLKMNDVVRSLERTAASVFAVIQATCNAGKTELLLIDCQEEFVNPSKKFIAMRAS
ncbi:MAG: pyridoxal kinase [Termitinemataceae bacterium]|nr:MAG: pyridoxal kinase [Termitinemataceae bacterium]